MLLVELHVAVARQMQHATRAKKRTGQPVAMVEPVLKSPGEMKPRITLQQRRKQQSTRWSRLQLNYIEDSHEMQSPVKVFAITTEDRLAIRRSVFGPRIEAFTALVAEPVFRWINRPFVCHRFLSLD